MTIWEILGIIVGAIVVLVIGFLLGMAYRKKVAEREISSAEEEAKRIINESIKAAENKKREALVEAREEIHKSRAEYEREVKERRSELSKQERDDAPTLDWFRGSSAVGYAAWAACVLTRGERGGSGWHEARLHVVKNKGGRAQTERGIKVWGSYSYTQNMEDK